MVQRIKAIPNETKLLVVDQATEEYYKRQSIIVKSTLPNVLHLSSEQRESHGSQEASSNQQIEDEDEAINYQLRQEAKNEHSTPPPLPMTLPPPLEDDELDRNSLASSSAGKVRFKTRLTVHKCSMQFKCKASKNLC